MIKQKNKLEYYEKSRFDFKQITTILRANSYDFDERKIS